MLTLRNYLTHTISATLVCILLCMVAGCEKALQLKEPSTYPTAVFDELWTEMDQHYSLFPYKGVDWDSARTQFRSRIHDDMTKTTLFNVLADMLATLKDGHITLISDVDTFTYLDFYTSYPLNFNYKNVVNNYLQNEYSASGPIIYKIQSGTGYLYYKSFADNSTDQQIDKVLTDMAQTKGLIIDVRSNTGGLSQNADRLFQRFATEKTLVKYEMGKNAPAHTAFQDPQPYYLSPAGQHYSNPVVVLTNRACFSACNDFVLYMSQLPNVKLFGDQTGGGGGIPKNYILSNGWILQYTSTVTLSPSRQPVEGGIQPTVNVGISSLDEANGKDPILEAAFQSLQ